MRGERGVGRARWNEWASIPAMLNTARHMVLLPGSGETRP